MKKLVCVLLALIMVLAMSIPAFAAGETNLTINSTENRTYKAYKLLDLSTSLKPDHVAHEGNCDEDCYNYSYTKNDKYFSILQTIVDEDDAANVTIDDVLAFLDDDNIDMQTVADIIYRAIIAAPLSEDETITNNSGTLGHGYWLFADTTNVTGDKVNSLVMVNTKGLDDLTITPKTALPTIVKKVLDVNDTTGANGWYDSADHDINDVVSFQLTATLPDKFASYASYQLKFQDNLSDGFDLTAGSVTVTVYADNTKQQTLTITDKYTINYQPQDNTYDFEVVFTDVTTIANITKDAVFEVSYTATLNEDAVIGTAGNPNEVTLVFSNNPYGNTTGNISDKVTVFTYELIINKVDGEGNALADAEFTLYKKGTDGQYDPLSAATLSNDGTTFTWTGLDDGDYKLVEDVAPAGYNKLDAPIEFTISAEHSEEADEPALTSLNGGNTGVVRLADGQIEKDVENNTGTILPETGGVGTMWLIIGGTVLVLFAGVFMITRKKMSVYQD